ncbi:MAG: glycosyltransferase family 2 protein, partial [Pseudomonadota bacterium]
VAGLVSVIIPVFNRRNLLLKTLDSVAEQTYENIEILLVDDGSDEEYAEFYRTLPKTYNGLTLFRQANLGPGAAREHARRNARGEFIPYLDSDDILASRKLSQQVATLRAKPEAGICYGAVGQIIDDKISDIPIRKTHIPNMTMLPSLLIERWWQTAAPLYRRSLTDRVGAWTNLINEEDWEYDLRAASLGTQLCYADEIVCYRTRHDDHLSHHGDKDRNKLQSRAQARGLMYQSARSYERQDFKPLITKDDWDFFGRSAFLLARQCASVGLEKEYSFLFDISVDAIGKRTVQHRLFSALVTVFGSRFATRLIVFVGR